MNAGMPALETAPSLRQEDSREWAGQMVESVTGECLLLERLETVLLEQREAVRCDDLEALEDGTHAARKILRTLAAARRRRETLLELGTGDPRLPLAQLETTGLRPTPEFLEARQRLQGTAQRVSLALAINRRLLEEASRSTDRGVRALLGETPHRVASRYAESTVPGRSLDGGRHLNRQV